MYTVQKDILKHTSDNNSSHASQKCLRTHSLLKVEALQSNHPVVIAGASTERLELA